MSLILTLGPCRNALLPDAKLRVNVDFKVGLELTLFLPYFEILRSCCLQACCVVPGELNEELSSNRAGHSNRVGSDTCRVVDLFANNQTSRPGSTTTCSIQAARKPSHQRILAASRLTEWCRGVCLGRTVWAIPATVESTTPIPRGRSCRGWKARFAVLAQLRPI